MTRLEQEMRTKSIEAENKYREWLNTQAEAVKEVKEIIKTAKLIKNEKNRKAYLKREKSHFDTKWVEIYSKS